MSPLADDDTILATNTSGLSITHRRSRHEPERFLIMHWFNQPTLIPLIEIIKNDKTRPDVAQTIYNLALAIHKKPALVEKDVPGFARPTGSSWPCCAKCWPWSATAWSAWRRPTP